MKIYQIKSVTYEDDWRFLDIEADIFDIPDDRVAKKDCSVCALQGYAVAETIRIVIPYSKLRKMRDK